MLVNLQVTNKRHVFYCWKVILCIYLLNMKQSSIRRQHSTDIYTVITKSKLSFS